MHCYQYMYVECGLYVGKTADTIAILCTFNAFESRGQLGGHVAFQNNINLNGRIWLQRVICTLWASFSFVERHQLDFASCWLDIGIYILIYRFLVVAPHIRNVSLHSNIINSSLYICIVQIGGEHIVYTHKANLLNTK